MTSQSIERDHPPCDQCTCEAAGGIDLCAVAGIVQRIGKEPAQTIALLQALQAHYHYLPLPVLEKAAELTGIPPARLMSVATFFKQFRHQPVGAHRIRVCIGTACHVKGAPAVIEAFRDTLAIPAGDDTDPSKEYTIEEVACLGCCTLAPVVQMDQLTYGHVTRADAPTLLRDFSEALADAAAGGPPGPLGAPAGSAEIRVGMGSCCMVKGSDRILALVRAEVQALGLPVAVRRVGCVGMCYQTPVVEVVLPGAEPVLYASVKPEDAPAIVHRHFPAPSLVRRIGRWLDRRMEGLLTGEHEGHRLQRYCLHPRDLAMARFTGPQVRIATHGFGLLDPLGFEEYEADGGFQALRKVLTEWGPDRTIQAVLESGLRGRGGAGFPTGRKWRIGRDQPGTIKYVLCNGDEGDPGAFMDRMLLETFPFRILEGMAIQAFCVGASQGYLYIRAEYPLAVERIRLALAECQKRGILGDDICGSGFSLRLEIKEGAGAFVCGEESAMIEAIEGKRGFPRVRPPFPAQAGLWGRPTVVNNVETLALVPWIIRHGPAAFAAQGTADSKGTKVFALAGKIARGGLIEVPMGVTLRQVVEDIGGGIADGHTFKAVQIGGPSGGMIPAALADTPIDYQALSALGAMMGSGGLVVLDDRDCMVDMARYFLSFTQDEACGQCSIGRVGTRRMLDLMERLCRGEGRKSDLEELESLAKLIKTTALCQLCRTAPNPVLTSLKYFRDEYEAHLQGRCPAGKCKNLIRYEVDDTCHGCTLCAQACPVAAIPLTPFRRHGIDATKCTRCDVCRPLCPIKAIHVR